MSKIAVVCTVCDFYLMPVEHIQKITISLNTLCDSFIVKVCTAQPLSGPDLWIQQAEQRCPDLSLSGPLFYLFLVGY